MLTDIVFLTNTIAFIYLGVRVGVSARGLKLTDDWLKLTEMVFLSNTIAFIFLGHIIAATRHCLVKATGG